MKGLFVTFEGPDGAGKSTQIKKFVSYLKSRKIPFLLTREPGGTPLGDRIRRIVLDPEHGRVDERAETLLYLASRAQNVKEVILPALEQGKIVVCDRFSDSTLAYQGFARKLGMDEIAKLNEFATGGLKPNLTFLLDAPTEALRIRRVNRKLTDRMELEKVEFQEMVRQGFLELAEMEPDRVYLLAALQPVIAIQKEIIRIFESHFEIQEGEA